MAWNGMLCVGWMDVCVGVSDERTLMSEIALGQRAQTIMWMSQWVSECQSVREGSRVANDEPPE